MNDKHHPLPFSLEMGTDTPKNDSVLSPGHGVIGKSSSCGIADDIMGMSLAMTIAETDGELAMSNIKEHVTDRAMRTDYATSRFNPALDNRNKHHSHL